LVKKSLCIIVTLILFLTACSVNQEKYPEPLEKNTEQAKQKEETVSNSPNKSPIEEKNVEIVAEVVSPDKKYTAYLVGKSWDRRLFISIGQDFQNAKEMKVKADNFSDLSWSSNSKYILLDWPDLKRAMVVNTQEEYSGVNIDYETGPFWSPDGDKICFTQRREVWSGGGDYVKSTDLLIKNFNNDLYFVPIAMGTKEYFYTVEGWGQDGIIKYKQLSNKDNEVLADLSTEYAHYLWSLDSKTGKKKSLGTIKDLQYYYFNPSPDRNWLSMVRITFDGGEAQGGMPVFYNTNTGEIKELDEEFYTWFWDAKWFADSAKILLDETSVYEVGTGKLNKFQLPEDLLLLGGSPAPSGEKIAVFACQLRDHGDRDGIPLSLLILDLEGQVLINLPTSLFPRYSSNLQTVLPIHFQWLDGEKVVIETWNQETDKPSIQILDINSGAISLNLPNYIRPTVSPDGKKIAIMEVTDEGIHFGQQNIKVLSINGETTHSLSIKDVELDYFDNSLIKWDNAGNSILTMTHKNNPEGETHKYLLTWDLLNDSIGKIEIDNSLKPIYLEKDEIVCVGGNIYREG